MGAGLDELIESLLTEIAFSGVRGCSVSNLLNAIEAFYKPSPEGAGYEDGRIAQGATAYGSHGEPQQVVKRHDLAVASKVWRWLAARSDVSIGANREFNHMSLEEVLALPEKADPAASGPSDESIDKPSSGGTRGQSHPRPAPRTSRDENSGGQPRLHVSEERQWRTITGHGPDLKRVPLFEWRALVDIASVKEKGILQGDLVRLTGQDKRSLPTRTDALARKGYVIKQPVVLRGGKSSKLWIAQFAENAREDQEREGLDYDNIDLSRAALTSDLNPVPFCDKWNGDTIDYLALAQAFVAIVKAWVLIRYCDARSKLGVEERVRQMRALAKTCRWLTNIGSLSFVGAKFAGSNRLFKDCVKFIRDPSPAEWSHFRATPKTRMVVPSGRIGKRGEASRAVHASQVGGPRGKAAGKKAQVTKSRSCSAPHASIIPSPWKPQKPVPNTAFEVIKRAGPKGTSNAAVCRQTLGHNYRRLAAAMTGSISMPTNSQPLHLRHLSSTSQLSRIGKTMTYTFFATSEIAANAVNDLQSQASSVSKDTAIPAIVASNVPVGRNGNLFSQPTLSQFSSNTASSLTEITRTQQSRRAFSRKLKRRRPVLEEPEDQIEDRLPKRRGRQLAKSLIDEPSLGLAEQHSRLDLSDLASTSQTRTTKEEPSQPDTLLPPPRPPGVYRGLPNSLDPVTRRKGRKRRSLVLIFRSDKLKDPLFLGLPSSTQALDGADSSNHQKGTEIASSRPSIPIREAYSTELSLPAATTPIAASEGLPVQSRTLQSKKNGAYWCDKCGNSWKNSNGLEYHLTKSRSACNPDFVPPSSELINHRKRKSAQPQVLERSPAPRQASEEHAQSRQTLTPKEQVESRIDRKKRPVSSRSHDGPSLAETSMDGATSGTPPVGDAPLSRTHRGSIILKDLQVYDATDHQRVPHQRLSRAGKDTPNNMPTPTEYRQPSPKHRHPKLLSAELPVKGQIRQLHVGDGRGPGSPLDHSPNDSSLQPNSLSKSSSFPTAIDASEARSSATSGNKAPVALSTERSGVRKPLPSFAANKLRNSDPSSKPPITQPTGASVIETAAEKSGVPLPYLDAISNPNIARQATHKSLASFARPTRANASFGARRRDRTMQIVEYLLERNNGVFPGLRSLFMAVISVWAKEFKDLAPPDRRICQNTVNQMERDGILKQMHFFFFDDQAKMQECVVLAKADTKSGLAVDSSDDPRVIAVKEKMREMFPEAYVPDAFSLSPEEAKLFDELASQGKEYNQTRSLRAPKDLKKVQDIETLRYENSVMGDISIHKHSAKRSADEVQVTAQPLSKKARVDFEQSDMHEKTRKTRKRPEKHEMWDSGKLAVYIWSQRQKPGTMWDQHHGCLQDFTTGAWSWTPDTEASQTGSITSILSSVKSARHIDASIKRKGRNAWVDIDVHAGSNMHYKNGNQNSEEVQIIDDDESTTDDDDLMVDGYEQVNFHGHVSQGNLKGYIVRAPTHASFALDHSISDEEDDDAEDIFEESIEVPDNDVDPSDVFEVKFAPTEALSNNANEIWPKLPVAFFQAEGAKSFALVGPMPSALWLLKENLPRDLHEILSTARRQKSFGRWADPVYGKFLRNLKTIKRWEQSADGAQILTQGTVAPDYVFISLTTDASESSMEPMSLEWLAANHFTTNNVPDEVKNASPEDEEFGLFYHSAEDKITENNQNYLKKSGGRTTNNGNSRPKSASQKLAKQTQNTMPQRSASDALPEGFIEYKTRDLTIIPKQPRGRFNKPAAHDDKLGSKREDELLAACVVFRTLLGGLDRNLDIGLLLKHFPGMSLSAIKKFWPRISRERKSYVQALTAKFQSAFLEAYENGKLPPLDYDDIENYDWATLILWATKLETHEDVDLPESRQELYEKNLVENVADEAADWRETWFAITSTYNRIEAVASETMSIPLPPKDQQDKIILERARTWVRSICCTSLRGVNVRDKLIPRLLELGNGDAAETNRILEKVVAELNKEKVITRTKGKDLGGNFRIHGMFSKQLEKMASTPKFRQAIAFKSQLDEVFRRSEEHFMPYASDDGSIMAVLNLQAHGRIRIDPVDMPNIPFGFEPGNYEGRTFPKSYYHFKVRLVPTQTYLFNDDMALLKQAQDMEPPTRGPGGTIPIWVDFFGKVNAARWADYVSMVVFTLAIKGPTVPKMCVTLLKPMIDEFEVQLIIEWLDKLGLLQRAVNDCGVTTAEWWWLVVGHIVQLNDRRVGKGKLAQVGA